MPVGLSLSRSRVTTHTGHDATRYDPLACPCVVGSAAPGATGPARRGASRRDFRAWGGRCAGAVARRPWEGSIRKGAAWSACRPCAGWHEWPALSSFNSSLGRAGLVRTERAGSLSSSRRGTGTYLANDLSHARRARRNGRELWWRGKYGQSFGRGPRDMEACDKGPRGQGA